VKQTLSLISRFLLADQHTYAIQCHSRCMFCKRWTVEKLKTDNTGKYTN